MRVELEYLEYLNKLSPEEREYVKKFYNEYYRAPIRTEDSIIKDPDMIKEANRVHNTMYSDMFSIAEKTGGLAELSEDEEQFMSDASDTWDWNDVYKAQGYEAAIKEIFYQTERDIKNPKIEIQLTLARFLNKYLALKRTDDKIRHHSHKNPKKKAVKRK